MRKTVIFLLSFSICAATFAQVEKKPSSIGFSIAATDFIAPADIKNSSLKDAKIGGLSKMNPSFTLSYWRWITKKIDVSVAYTGSFLERKPVTFPDPKANYFHSLEAAFNVRMLEETAVINPFVTAGLGAYNYRKTYGAQVPLGVGLQFNPFQNNAYLMLQAQYKIRLNDVQTNHFVYSFGVVVPVAEPKVKAVPPPPPPVVVAAPVVVVPKPVDTDSDGLTDDVDKCPTVAGLAKYGGCPIPDTDADGVNDELDKCISVSGFARYEGCPIPDTDGDGVNNEEDKCPDEAGPADNQGCPKLEQYNFNAKNVQFATGSATLITKAKLELDELVVIMNDHPTVGVAVDGYTDNTGKAATNLALSQKRANAVKAYLVKKGISAERITATGHGIDNPVADNKTASGRLENRRVEFKAVH